MTRSYVANLGDGDSVDEVFLVADKQLRTNRNGNLYLQLELRDRTGVVSARQWNATENEFHAFDRADFVRVKGKVQLFQGTNQLILNQLSVMDSDKVDLEEFLPSTDKDLSQLLEKLRAILLKMSNHHLRGLVESFLMDDEFVRGFMKAPAGIKNHHAYLGGLLDHVVTLLDAADRILPVYPDVDRDIALTGILLHDIGKVRELGYDRMFEYTDEGQLIGHLVIGVEMLNEKAGKVKDLTGEDFPRELLLRLKHLIVSHHGTYEFGSPKLPMTPEAIFLHHLDNLDAKVHSFVRDIQDDPDKSSSWTAYSQATQRKLFKGGIEE